MRHHLFQTSCVSAACIRNRLSFSSMSCHVDLLVERIVPWFVGVCYLEDTEIS